MTTMNTRTGSGTVLPHMPAGPSPMHRAIMVAAVKEQEPLGDVLMKAGKRALGGGIAGAGAMVVQVSTLMWMRTTMNFQYREGMSSMQAFKHLYKVEGGGGLSGIRRLYRGYIPALAQGPLSRFGDTAANAGMLALLDSYDSTKNLPVGVKTGCASFSAGIFRVFLMPIDFVKTTLQVEGNNGWAVMGSKIKAGGLPVIYGGSLAAASATWVGHFPWFYTYNTLDAYLAKPAEFMPSIGNELAQKLVRSACIGFTASVISDTASNSVRVIKTVKQTSKVNVTYMQAINSVVEKDGVIGLFGRGLSTRIAANGMQGIMFSVLWRLGQDYLNKPK